LEVEQAAEESDQKTGDKKVFVKSKDQSYGDNKSHCC